MSSRDRDVSIRRGVVYAVTGLGLVAGLLVVLLAPFPTAALNRLVGGVLLAVAVAGVAVMIVGFGGPSERGPDF